METKDNKAWNNEDEKRFRSCLWHIANSVGSTNSECSEWLELVKQRLCNVDSEISRLKRKYAHGEGMETNIVKAAMRGVLDEIRIR